LPLSPARGFLYLAVVLDAWSRRIVGWAFSAWTIERIREDARGPSTRFTGIPLGLLDPSGNRLCGLRLELTRQLFGRASRHGAGGPKARQRRPSFG